MSFFAFTTNTATATQTEKCVAMLHSNKQNLKFDPDNRALCSYSDKSYLLIMAFANWARAKGMVASTVLTPPPPLSSALWAAFLFNRYDDVK